MRVFSKLLLEGEGGSEWTTYLLLGGAALLLIVFFFFNSRGNKKRVKEMEKNLRTGAKVTTIGGIIGEVTELTDAEVTVKTGDNGENVTYLRLLRQAISYVYPENTAGEKKEEPVYNEIK